MTAEVLRMPRPERARLFCSACGTEAACDCGAPYIPAGELAAKARAQNPGISARALAAQLGINRSTIDRAEISTGANAPVETTTRIGRDGKERVLPTARTPRHLPDVSPPRVEEAQATSPHEDHLAPFEADRAIRNTANYVKGAFLNPPPGIRGCLREAMARASPDDVRTIIAAANFLLELKDAANGN